MKLKLDANGHVVVENGMPVYVHDDGKESPFDAATTVANISRLNGESKAHRERAEKAEGLLKPYEGITDPVAAKKAMDIVKNLDDKKLVDAGEVEKVKNEAIKAVRAEYEPVVKKVETLQSQLYGEKIGGAFARSAFIKDKTVLPPDFAEARFAKHFKMEEDGSVVPYDIHGNKIFSRARPGETASFDEALEVLVDAYPQKASILKGTGASGSGTPPSGGGGGNNGGKRSVKRSEFDAMSAVDKSTLATEAAQGKAQIVEG